MPPQTDRIGIRIHYLGGILRFRENSDGEGVPEPALPHAACTQSRGGRPPIGHSQTAFVLSTPAHPSVVPPSPGQRSCPLNGRAKRLACPGPPSRQDHRYRARDVSRCALTTSNRTRSRPTGSRPAAPLVSAGCSAARLTRSPSPRRARTSCHSGSVVTPISISNCTNSD